MLPTSSCLRLVAWATSWYSHCSYVETGSHSFTCHYIHVDCCWNVLKTNFKALAKWLSVSDALFILVRTLLSLICKLGHDSLQTPQHWATITSPMCKLGHDSVQTPQHWATITCYCFLIPEHETVECRCSASLIVVYQAKPSPTFLWRVR